MGPFKIFEAEVEKAIQAFPLHNRGAQPIRDDIMRLTRVPWLRAFGAKPIVAGFRETSIYPLDVTKISGIVGCGPSTVDLPYIQATLQHLRPLEVTGRTKRKWSREGLDHTAVSVSYRQVDQICNLLNAPKRRRSGGTFLDEGAAKKMAYGGQLMTTDAMVSVMTSLSAERALKCKIKEEKRIVRIEKQRQRDSQNIDRNVAQLQSWEEFKDWYYNHPTTTECIV